MLPAAEPWLVDRFAEMRAEARPGGPARIVAVLGGRGGAGASVLAGGLAVTAARSRLRTLLVDADPLGGGLDLVLGWEQLEGLRWPGAHRRRRAGRPTRRWSRPCPAAATWWCSPGIGATCCTLPAEAMAATLDAGRRGRDLVVVDLPRQLDDAAVDRPAGRRPDLLVVVPAELRATAAAARVVATAAPHCADLSVIVRGPAPGPASRPPRWPGRSACRSPARCAPSRACAGRWNGARRPPPTGRGPLAALCQRLVAELTGAPAGRCGMTGPRAGTRRT